MCKSRIEQTAKEVAGVSKAQWNKESKQLLVQVQNNISQLDIEKAIAASGHDTKAIKSKDSNYQKLPECCQYDRI